MRGQLSNAGGHLLSLNEVKDHWRNMRSLRHKITPNTQEANSFEVSSALTISNLVVSSPEERRVIHYLQRGDQNPTKKDPVISADQEKKMSVLQMFMGNEHKQKIKEIYSQTDKIIKETLSAQLEKQITYYDLKEYGEPAAQKQSGESEMSRQVTD